MKNLIYLTLLGFLIISCSKTDDSVIEEEFECLPASSLEAKSIEYDRAELTWRNNGFFEEAILEYGKMGFTAGEGVIVEMPPSLYTAINLIASTDYEFFVTSICLDGISFKVSPRKAFRTADCPIVNVYDAISIKENSATIRWTDISFVNNYEVEYGEEGFELGTGTTRMVTDTRIDLINLKGGTLYDVYVRTKCGEVLGDYSEKFTFETLPLCYTPTNIYWVTLTTSSVRIAWNGHGESNWQIQYGNVGFPLGTGTFLNTSFNPYTIQGLQSNKTYEIYIRANCGADGYSKWSNMFVVTIP